MTKQQQCEEESKKIRKKQKPEAVQIEKQGLESTS
jgi:hypothetical protein